MKKTLTILVFLLPAYLAGCASQEEKVVIPLDNDPRIGEEVQQLCFTGNINSWSEVDNDRHAVILRKSVKDYYKLKITPGCDPQWAMSTIALISRPSSPCLTRGDRIKTDADPFRGLGSACIITRINKWDPDAAKPTEQQPEEVQTGQ
jgi:hypothetical protein